MASVYVTKMIAYFKLVKKLTNKIWLSKFLAVTVSFFSKLWYNKN